MNWKGEKKKKKERERKGNKRKENFIVLNRQFIEKRKKLTMKGEPWIGFPLTTEKNKTGQWKENETRRNNQKRKEQER